MGRAEKGEKAAWAWAWALRGLGIVLALAGGAQHAFSADLSEWKVSKDGQVLTDSVSKLRWERCAQGQRWAKGSCNGEPALLSWTQAEALISQRNRETGKKCRQATLAEWQRLMDRGVFTGQGQAVLFPATSADWRWTGTRVFSFEKGNQYNYADNVTGRKPENKVELAVANAWAINLATGETRNDVNRRTLLPVQFVCPASN